MRRPLQIRRYGSLALRFRLQRLWIIVVSRIRQSKQHEHVSSSECRGTGGGDDGASEGAGGTGGGDDRAIGSVVKQLDAKTIAHTKVSPIGSTTEHEHFYQSTGFCQH